MMQAPVRFVCIAYSTSMCMNVLGELDTVFQGGAPFVPIKSLMWAHVLEKFSRLYSQFLVKLVESILIRYFLWLTCKILLQLSETFQISFDRLPRIMMIHLGLFATLIIIILQQFFNDCVWENVFFVSACVMWPAIPTMTTTAKPYYIPQAHEHAVITQYTFLPTAECGNPNV